MSDMLRGLGLLAVGALLYAALTSAPHVPGPVTKPLSNPTPAPQPDPSPCPGPGPCPKRPSPRVIDQRPLGSPLVECGKAGALVGKITLGGPVGPDGTEVAVDFPQGEDIRNIGSRRDGAGMCVMSSVEMAARWAGLEQMRGLRDWCAREAGGAYPAKVDDQLARFCKAKGIDCPAYVQYEGRDPAILDLVAKTGRAAGVTYNGRDGVRYRGSIAHMVMQAGLTGSYGTVYDNNGRPGELIWLPRGDYLERWTGGGGGWAFVWLAAGPPAPPRNLGAPPRPAPQTTATPDRTDFVEVDGYTWHASGPDWVLRRGGDQVGVWMARDGKYWVLSGGRWHTESLPLALPGKANCRDYGVCSSRLGQREGYSLTGQPVTQDKAFSAIRGPSSEALRDDSGLPRLTLAGPADACGAILTALARDPRREQVIAQAYRPGSWQLDSGHTVSPEGVTAYLAKASGEVLVRREGMQAADLDEVLSAGGLRKRDPDYDPKKDPSGRPLLSIPVILGLPAIPLSLVAAAGVLALALLVPVRKGGAS